MEGPSRQRKLLGATLIRGKTRSVRQGKVDDQHHGGGHGHGLGHSHGHGCGHDDGGGSRQGSVLGGWRSASWINGHGLMV